MYDLLIVGSGPAGLTAAIYSSRAFLKTLVLAGDQKGGQLISTTSVDNFPGFPDGIMGPELMMRLEEQAKKFGTEITIEEATDIIQDGENFLVNGKYQSKTVLVASGASHRHLGILEEKVFAGKGVSYCATCDAFFFRDKVVAVVGGGDSAMEEANFITKFARKVYLIHRREEFRASKIMIDKVKHNSKIELVLNREVKSLQGDGVLQKIILSSTVSEPDLTLEIDGLFVAIGLVPNSQWIQKLVALDEKKYIKKNPDLGFAHQTSCPGIFAAGDVTDPVYRQAVVAAGDGAAAALEIIKFVEKK